MSLRAVFCVACIGVITLPLLWFFFSFFFLDIIGLPMFGDN